MDLKKYLTETDQRTGEFARKVATHRCNINRYLQHGRFPDLPMLSRIKHATGGKVMPNDFLENWERRNGINPVVSIAVTDTHEPEPSPTTAKGG